MSSELIAAASSTPIAVRPVPIIATATSSDTWSGRACSTAAFATADSAYPPPAGPMYATTRLPSHDGSTSGPSAVTTPATSRPGVIGRAGKGNGPCWTPARMVVSTTCTPAADTAIRTWPGPGTGSGTSSRTRFSAGPKVCWRMACTGVSSVR